MMKLTVSTEAEEVVKRISPKVRTANRYSAKSASALVSALILEVEPLLTPALITAMAAKLVSRAGRKRALLASLARVAQTADESQLRRLENQLRRIQAGHEGVESAQPIEKDKSSSTGSLESGEPQ